MRPPPRCAPSAPRGAAPARPGAGPVAARKPEARYGRSRRTAAWQGGRARITGLQCARSSILHITPSISGRLASCMIRQVPSRARTRCIRVSGRDMYTPPSPRWRRQTIDAALPALAFASPLFDSCSALHCTQTCPHSQDTSQTALEHLKAKKITKKCTSRTSQASPTTRTTAAHGTAAATATRARATSTHLLEAPRAARATSTARPRPRRRRASRSTTTSTRTRPRCRRSGSSATTSTTASTTRTAPSTIATSP